MKTIFYDVKFEPRKRLGSWSNSCVDSNKKVWDQVQIKKLELVMTKLKKESTLLTWMGPLGPSTLFIALSPLVLHPIRRTSEALTYTYACKLGQCLDLKSRLKVKRGQLFVYSLDWTALYFLTNVLSETPQVAQTKKFSFPKICIPTNAFFFSKFGGAAQSGDHP